MRASTEGSADSYAIYQATGTTRGQWEESQASLVGSPFSSSNPPIVREGLHQEIELPCDSRSTGMSYTVQWNRQKNMGWASSKPSGMFSKPVHLLSMHLVKRIKVCSPGGYTMAVSWDHTCERPKIVKKLEEEFSLSAHRHFLPSLPSGWLFHSPMAYIGP